MRCYPKSHMILPFSVLQQMYQDPIRCNCRIKTSPDIGQKFEELCNEYGAAFSKNNKDIGRTKLVKMDIDTGDSPLVSSRPYTLPLKHYEWVQREIETLEHAGVITKSMSKWASPIVIIPKKSAPREPQREDYVLISEKSMSYNKRSSQQERPRARFPSIHS